MHAGGKQMHQVVDILLITGWQRVPESVGTILVQAFEYGEDRFVGCFGDRSERDVLLGVCTNRFGVSSQVAGAVHCLTRGPRLLRVVTRTCRRAFLPGATRERHEPTDDPPHRYARNPMHEAPSPVVNELQSAQFAARRNRVKLKFTPTSHADCSRSIPASCRCNLPKGALEIISLRLTSQKERN